MDATLTRHPDWCKSLRAAMAGSVAWRRSWFRIILKILQRKSHGRFLIQRVCHRTNLVHTTNGTKRTSSAAVLVFVLDDKTTRSDFVGQLGQKCVEYRF